MRSHSRTSTYVFGGHNLTHNIVQSGCAISYLTTGKGRKVIDIKNQGNHRYQVMKTWNRVLLLTGHNRVVWRELNIQKRRQTVERQAGTRSRRAGLEDTTLPCMLLTVMARGCSKVIYWTKDESQIRHGVCPQGSHCYAEQRDHTLPLSVCSWEQKNAMYTVSWAHSLHQIGNSCCWIISMCLYAIFFISTDTIIK